MSIIAETTAQALAKDGVLLSARDIVKSYGGVYALKGVNFEIHRGKVTRLFGENGAGKSTLMKILSGVEKPTSGEIELDCERVAFTSSSDARDHGISIIHQELSLAPNLSVRDNIFMGREIRMRTGVNFAEEARQTRALMEELEEDVDPMTLIRDLRLVQQQVVEIARALSVDSRILIIMDEPTSALSASGVEVLFKVIRDLTSRGVSIVYISHHFEEALQVTDYAVVLRDGRAQGHRSRLDHAQHGGRELRSRLAADRLRIRRCERRRRIRLGRVGGGSSVLEVRAGEIVCIYGLMGAGRTELLEAVAGRTRLPVTGGRILLEGENMAGLSIAGRIGRGFVLMPEDRQRNGLVSTMSVGSNMSFAIVRSFVKGLLMSPPTKRELVGQSIRNVHVKTAGAGASIRSLSGGNQQKVVIGKMLATSPKVILLDEPSRGIDIGAKSEVFRLLAENAKKGRAVMYSTSEVGECLSVAHPIIVMRRGKISAEFGPDADKDDIMAVFGEAVMA